MTYYTELDENFGFERLEHPTAEAQLDFETMEVCHEGAFKGVASEKCEFTTLRICMILCNIMINAAIAKTHSIYFWHWLLVKVYKTTHKQCTNRKGHKR